MPPTVTALGSHRRRRKFARISLTTGPSGAPLPRFPAQALYNLGVAHAEGGNPHRAAIFYHMTVMLQPTCSEAWNNLGVISKSYDTLEQSIEYFMRAVMARPQFAQPLNNLGIVYTLQARKIRFFPKRLSTPCLP